MNEAESKPRCPYCSKEIEVKTTREIIDRAYNAALRRQVVRKTLMDFCSPQCGGNYQMGCEG